MKTIYQKKIISYNIYTKEVLHFESIAKAGEYFNIYPQSVSQICNKKNLIGKEEIFFFANEFNKEEIDNRIQKIRQRKKRRNERITFVNPLTKEQYDFKNPKEASTVLKISGFSIRDALRGTTITTGGLIVLYTLDLNKETIETKIEKYKEHLFYKNNLIKLKASVNSIRGD